MKIGVYVGSFNPPHLGHIKCAQYLIDNNYVDKVLMLPTTNYWNKQNLVSIFHRVNMLRFYETDKIIVDDIHNNYLYSYMVLESIHKDYPKDALYLIIGADNLEKFHLWKRLDIIFKYKIIVLNRNGDDYFKYLNNYNNNKDKFIILSNFQSIDISSTIIRNNLNSKYISDRVRKYIVENNLYNKE